MGIEGGDGGGNDGGGGGVAGTGSGDDDQERGYTGDRRPRPWMEIRLTPNHG